MPPYRLLKHHEYDRSAHRLPNAIQNKALWAQMLLGIRGRTPTVKGVKGYNERWRRTPVQGNHFYLWWIPHSESAQVAGWQQHSERDNNTILVHSIRHHDETDDPIDLGAPDDYDEVSLPQIDPRFEDQIAVSHRVRHEMVSLATLKGLPGSGKTVSLLYIVKDLAERGDLRKILYITYTQRLKRMAKEFFDAQGEAVSRRISLRTLGELESELAGQRVSGEPFSELEAFSRFLDAQNPASLGTWRKYPTTFYTELRAHLLGRSFPSGYTLDNGNGQFSSLFQNSPLQDANAYARTRELDPSLATIALRVLDRLQGRFFVDQHAAHRSLQVASQDKLPRWLNEIDGLVVDEVQDLTLLQIALLGEIGRSRLRRDDYSPLSILIAGDESQIVQPSGFDWGAAKDLLGEQIGLYPDEFEFEHQRRAPRNIAHLIDATWNLYLRLPKQLRPSSKRQSFIYEDPMDSTSDEEIGRILLCPLPADQDANARWGELLVELGDKPGRALIDLSEDLMKALRISGSANATDSVGNVESTRSERSSEQGEETIFLAREIKGLERSTVIVHGLNEVYLRAKRLIDYSDGQQLPLYEARRIFDEVRVALSRSTDRIIFLDSPDAPVFNELGFNQLHSIFPIAWDDLLDLLRNEEVSDIEVIEGLLEEAEDLVERERWEQAYRNNRRAYELALQIGDLALQREAQQEYIRTHLYEAKSHLENGNWAKADQINQTAFALADAYGDPLLNDEVADQRQEIDGSLTYQAQNRLEAAKEARRQKQYKRAFSEVKSALVIAQASDDVDLQSQVDKLLSEVALQWATELATAKGAVSQLPEVYDAAVAALERQGSNEASQTLQILAQRYREVAQIGNLTPEQVSKVLSLLGDYLASLQPNQTIPKTHLVVQAWIEETFSSLDNQTSLFVQWTLMAIDLEESLGYAGLDNHLWELELRAQELSGSTLSYVDTKALAHFRAVSAAYTGDPVESSLAWEQLGEIPRAVEQARIAGDMERAYNLFRQNKNAGEIPEDLSTAVKAMRLLQQLEQKHHGLNRAERQTMLESLARLHTMLSAEEADE